MRWVIPCAFLVAGCSGSSADPPPPALPPAADHGQGVYSETEDYASVEAAVPDLAQRGLDLYQLTEEADFGNPKLASLIAACARQGVGFRAWIVVSREQGYWPNEANLAAFGATVDAFLAWVRKDQLPVAWVTFDLEPGWDYTQELLGLASAGKTLELVERLKAHHDPAAFASSRAALEAIVGRVHAAGMKAHAVTWPLVADDAADGDADIEDALDIPVRGLPWDEVSLMVYRSAMQAFTKDPLGPDLLYAYAADVKAQFGDQGGVDFGVIGTDPVAGSTGYTDPATLGADVAAARAAGVARLHLYSLEAARKEPSPDAWLNFAATPPAGQALEPTPATTSMRAMFTLLDDLLEPAASR